MYSACSLCPVFNDELDNLGVVSPLDALGSLSCVSDESETLSVVSAH